MADLLKNLLPYQSEFSHQWATWAGNHRGWAKMKKGNRRVAKSQLKWEMERRIREEMDDD